jgi:hypothetical protein
MPPEAVAVSSVPGVQNGGDHRRVVILGHVSKLSAGRQVQVDEMWVVRQDVQFLLASEMSGSNRFLHFGHAQRRERQQKASVVRELTEDLIPVK